MRHCLRTLSTQRIRRTRSCLRRLFTESHTHEHLHLDEHLNIKRVHDRPSPCMSLSRCVHHVALCMADSSILCMADSSIPWSSCALMRSHHALHIHKHLKQQPFQDQLHRHSRHLLALAGDADRHRAPLQQMHRQLRGAEFLRLSPLLRAPRYTTRLLDHPQEEKQQKQQQQRRHHSRLSLRGHSTMTKFQHHQLNKHLSHPWSLLPRPRLRQRHRQCSRCDIFSHRLASKRGRSCFARTDAVTTSSTGLSSQLAYASICHFMLLLSVSDMLRLSCTWTHQHVGDSVSSDVSSDVYECIARSWAHQHVAHTAGSSWLVSLPPLGHVGYYGTFAPQANPQHMPSSARSSWLVSLEQHRTGEGQVRQSPKSLHVQAGVIWRESLTHVGYYGIAAHVYCHGRVSLASAVKTSWHVAYTVTAGCSMSMIVCAHPLPLRAHPHVAAEAGSSWRVSLGHLGHVGYYGHLFPQADFQHALPFDGAHSLVSLKLHDIEGGDDKPLPLSIHEAAGSYRHVSLAHVGYYGLAAHIADHCADLRCEFVRHAASGSCTHVSYHGYIVGYSLSISACYPGDLVLHEQHQHVGLRPWPWAISLTHQHVGYFGHVTLVASFPDVFVTSSAYELAAATHVGYYEYIISVPCVSRVLDTQPVAKFEAWPHQHVPPLASQLSRSSLQGHSQSTLACNLSASAQHEQHQHVGPFESEWHAYDRQTELKHARIGLERVMPERADKGQQHSQQAHLHFLPLTRQAWFLLFVAGFWDSGRSWGLFSVFLPLRPRFHKPSGISSSLCYLVVFRFSCATPWGNASSRVLSFLGSLAYFAFPSSGVRERFADKCAWIPPTLSLPLTFLAQSARCISQPWVHTPKAPQAVNAPRVAQRHSGPLSCLRRLHEAIPSRSLRRLPREHAQSAWDARCRLFTRRHGTHRPLHPMRGQRVGEATQPGPSTPPPTTRGRSSSATRVLDTNASETPRQDGSGQEIQHIQLRLKAISGRLITLQCRWMKRDAAWKWFAETQGMRLHHQGRSTPGTILHEWLQRFDQHLTDEGVREIESALAIHPDPPHGPPDSLNRTPAGSDQMAGTPAAPCTPALSRLPGTPRGPRVPATPVSVPLPGPDIPPTQSDPRPPNASTDRCVGCHFWLGRTIPTQRQLPKTSSELVDTVCHRLLLLMGEPTVTAAQRRVLVSLVLTMPRWLWPEPHRNPGSQLHPHSRPRLLQERAQLLLQSDWDSLMASLQPDGLPPDDPPDVPPRQPGLLTDEDCKRLLRAGKQGRIATAWRQLFSFGLAPANDKTQKLIEDKWLPAPLFPDQLRGTFLCPADAKDLLTDERLLQVSRTLQAGSSSDALGWTHESWRSILHLPHGRRLVREMLTLYACGEIGHEGEDLVNASLLIPLYKNHKADAVRPIAVPSVFRKAYARATLAHGPAPIRSYDKGRGETYCHPSSETSGGRLRHRLLKD